jgi:hypothetical protein
MPYHGSCNKLAYGIVPVTLALALLIKKNVFHGLKTGFFCYSLKLNFICYRNRIKLQKGTIPYCHGKVPHSRKLLSLCSNDFKGVLFF